MVEPRHSHDDADETLLKLTPETARPNEGSGESAGEDGVWWTSDDEPPAWIYSKWARKIGHPAELWECQIYVQAAFGLFGTVILWVGLWDIVANGRLNSREFTNSRTRYRVAWNLVLGFVLCFWADNLMTQSGSMSTLWHPSLWGRTKLMRRRTYIIRYAAGLIGSIMIWTALYTATDSYIGTPGVLRECTFLIVGGLGVAICDGSIDSIAYVYTESSYNAEVVTWRDPWRLRAKHAVRAIVSIVFQNLLWVGAWNISGFGQYVILGGIDFYPWLLATLGIIAMLISKSFIGASFIEIGTDPSTGVSKELNLLHVVRSIVAAGGYLTFTNGLWVGLDLSMRLVFTTRRAKNATCVVLGLASMLFAGSAVGNVLPGDDEEEEEEEEEEEDDLAAAEMGDVSDGSDKESDFFDAQQSRRTNPPAPIYM